MVTGTSDSPQRPTDAYARLAHLLHTPTRDPEVLLARVYKELLARESRAYAAGWSDALTEVRRARLGRSRG
ncbi:hypothetical protein [Streptomyces beihaiensis]|uniref:Uncharacterized protein n=1 Tax=Streptomyces beihaiensis TaxID=2984495 RepID=A0ABT3TXV2_9ACTN|nr:hypothetical protein [Streptomyces beihaiensis]MCX3061879.1 hypothetical protein [Streptomyces beihaiensis]